jgi:hypothetical protein
MLLLETVAAGVAASLEEPLPVMSQLVYLDPDRQYICLLFETAVAGVAACSIEVTEAVPREEFNKY